MKSKALAALAFCLMFMVFVSPARAAGPTAVSVEIEPVSPEVWDDLTCAAEVSDSDGDLDGIQFRWYRNTVMIRYVNKYVSGSSDIETDVLDYEFTREGDQIRCNVDVWDIEENLTRPPR